MLNTPLSVRDRLDERARAWRVAVAHVLDTESSLIGFGRRGEQPVVLKVVKQRGDEWRSGEVLRALGGDGVVRVYEYVEGALLLEALSPAYSLVPMTLEGRDDDAIDIIAGIMHRMREATPTAACVAVEEWGSAFERYAAGRHRAIPPSLVDAAHGWFASLASSQRHRRLLHGDLHHYNVLFDSHRGWLAIDPKGVVGETEYEIGAVLRNPYEHPDLFTSTAAVERRVARFARRLNVDVERVLAWGFAQAVLSAIWCIEDGDPVDAGSRFVRLASTICQMLPAIP